MNIQNVKNKVKANTKIAFAGATKKALNRRNLKTNGISALIVTGICAAFGLVTGLGIPLYAVWCAAFFVAADGVTGAYSALKAAKPKYTTSFTADAEKVVRFKEFGKKTKALYKTELSTKEKIYLNLIDTPLSIAAAPILNIKNARNHTIGDGLIFDSNFKVYASGAAMTQIYRNGESLLPNKKFQARLSEIAARAFAECDDFSKSNDLRKKPPRRTKVTVEMKQ